MFAGKKIKWSAKAAAKSDLYRKYLAHKVLNQLPRYAKNRWEDFDPDDVLRYVGLTTAKPIRTGLGGIGAFIIGAAAGSIVALMLAPKAGTEMRTLVKDKATGYLNKQNVNLGVEKTASA
jgi:hypothetical protein